MAPPPTLPSVPSVVSFARAHSVDVDPLTPRISPPHDETVVSTRARPSSIDLPVRRPPTAPRAPTLPRPEPAAQMISPFELVSRRERFGGYPASRVLNSLPTFIREEAIRRVSEEVADARRSFDRAGSIHSIHSSHSDPGSISPPRTGNLRAPSARDVVSLREPMRRPPSDAQTVIPVIGPHASMATDFHRPSSEAGVRAPSINIFLGERNPTLSTPPASQTMASPLSVASAPSAPVFIPQTEEERAQAAEERRHDRRCDYWQKAGQSVGTLAAGLIGSVGLTLSACNCCNKEDAAGGGGGMVSDGNEQASLMGGFSLGWGG